MYLCILSTRGQTLYLVVQYIDDQLRLSFRRPADTRRGEHESTFLSLVLHFCYYQHRLLAGVHLPAVDLHCTMPLEMVQRGTKRVNRIQPHLTFTHARKKAPVRTVSCTNPLLNEYPDSIAPPFHIHLALFPILQQKQYSKHHIVRVLSVRQGELGLQVLGKMRFDPDQGLQLLVHRLLVFPSLVIHFVSLQKEKRRKRSTSYINSYFLMEQSILHPLDQTSLQIAQDFYVYLW